MGVRILAGRKKYEGKGSGQGARGLSPLFINLTSSEMLYKSYYLLALGLQSRLRINNPLVVELLPDANEHLRHDGQFFIMEAAVL